MDPIQSQSLKHFSEVRELLTSSGSSCPPMVISSLRQLQTVTEGGVAGRKRRRSFIQPQRVISSLYENTGRSNSSNNNVAGMETNGSAWDISAVVRKYLLPCAVLRKMQNPDVTETPKTKVKEGTGEGTTGSVPALENVVTETFGEPLRNAARCRRIGGGFMKIVLDDETTKEGRKCFNMDETPTRAPSQRSIAEKEALSNTNCATKSLNNVARTSGRGLETGEALTPEVTRADKMPALEVANGRNTHRMMRIETAPSQGAGEGGGRRREIFCNTSGAGARQSEVVEAHGRMTQTHSQSNLQRASSALPERESSSSVLDSARPPNNWNLSGTTVKMLREKVRRLHQLTEQESCHSENEHQLTPAKCLRWTRDDVEGEAFNNHLQKAKLSQLQSSPPKETTGIERNPKGRACSDDGLHSLGACNGEENTVVALPRSERQSQGDSDANKAESSAVVLPVGCRTPLALSLIGSVDSHFPYALCREGEVFASDGEPAATEKRGIRRNWFREQGTSAETRLIPYGGPFSTCERGGEKGRVGGPGQTDERVDKDQEADKDNNNSTPRNDSIMKQQRSLTIASCEDEASSEESRTQVCTVPPLPSQNRDDHATPSLVPVNPRIVHAAAGNSLRSPFQECSRPGYITQATTVSLYYHVQESSPRPRKRFPIHNFRETVWHASRSYPVVKGVSRDNAKRRWAVYWKGSRKYFYDKFNENCYHAYQQAVNFRRYSYIQHTSPGKSFAVAKTSPSHMNDGALLGQCANTNFDTTTAVNSHAGTDVLAENVDLDAPSPYRSKGPARYSPQDSLAFINDTPVTAANSHHPERGARTMRHENSGRCLEGACQLATRESFTLPEDRGDAFSSVHSSLPRKDFSVDPVLNVYKRALLMVLQELKDSLMGLFALPAPSECSSSRNDSPQSSKDCQEDQQAISCAQASRHLDNLPSSNLVARSAESTDPDRPLRPFLLQVVEWHLENVKLASQPGELQPLLSVFSCCFERLLLPRQAPRPLQQKMYRELMKLYNAQALSHLMGAQSSSV